jgi:UDP-N-acetylmuramoyl-tripeptide--D-alanyl-D-alanine ligase
MQFALRDFVQTAKGRLISGDAGRTFEKVSIDTRTLEPGDLFFAIQGPKFDGHDFLGEAVKRGASGLVIENNDRLSLLQGGVLPDVIQVPHAIAALQDLARWIRSRSKARVIGITGSNGKTTTKDMLASILAVSGRTLATRGNLNNYLGVPLTLCRLEGDHRFVVVEMGASQEGDIGLLAEIAKPEVGVITNIGKAHLQGFGSAEGILRVKKALFDALPEDGTAVINLDDPLLSPLRKLSGCRVLTFGTNGTADVSCVRVLSEMPLRFVLRLRGGESEVRVPLCGLFQVQNALAAAAAAIGLNIDTAGIVAGLESFTPTAMRMQVLEHKSGAVIVNDAYNANPSSVRASVESFCRSFSGKPLWLVLGDMLELGDFSRQEHEELGFWLAALPFERIFLYGRETKYLCAAAKTKNHALQIEHYGEKETLQTDLLQALSSRPAILFKGSRGMKMEDIIKNI